MNNPNNPFVPQGSFLEQKNRSRRRFKTAFFCVLAVNIIPITIALLMQGCRKPADEPIAGDPATNNTFAPVFDSSNPPIMDPVATPTNGYATAVPDPATQVPPMPSPTEYTVVAGDNFSDLAKKFGVTVRAIQEANPTVDPRRLQIGQKLQIPAPTVASTPSTAGTATEVAPGGETIYTVKSGDNLSKIAAEYHVTVRAIRQANNLVTDRIVVGQKLKIPAAAPPAAPAGTTNNQ